MASFQERIVGAAKLDPRAYAEIKADPNAFNQAIAVVALSTLAAGIGSMGGIGVVGGVIRGLVTWGVLAGVAFVVGTKLLPEGQTEADFNKFLRPMGFGAAPGIARILGIVPVLGPFFVFAASVWMIIATVFAVKAALSYTDINRAAAVCGIGLIFYIAFLFLVSIPFA
jgi:hypothetical protein